MKKLFCWVPVFLFLIAPVHAQDYLNHAQLSQKLKSLEAGSGGLAKLQSITKTAGGKDIWLMEIGSGDRASHPAIAVVGGIEGSLLISQQLAVGFIEKLLAASKTDSVKNLLATTTFYVYPAMSPDASEQYFAALKYERSGNATATDDDRDGRINEDPFEDLNGDGIITVMRVEDVTGRYKTHPADARIMVLANKEKGERGTHELYTEGIDNDKDKLFNEDGEGGIHFNKSLTFDPPYFAAGAGEHPVSELENRALLNLLHDQPNVFAVVSFGPANNLAEPWKFERSKTTARVLTGILESDARFNKMVSDLYKKSVNAKDAPAAAPAKGDFVQWAYFHYARLSFSTPGWWAPKFEIPKDSASAKKYKANEDKNTDVDFLRWAEKEGLDVFVPWKKINHPDFPGKVVEVGGFKPFVRTNPPAKAIDKATTDHTHFLVALANSKPELELLNQKTESLGDGISRITVTVHNKGLLPAVAEIAARNYWVKLINVSLTLTKDQALVSGNRVVVLNNLQPGESQEVSWLVKGKGTVVLDAGAPQTGFKKINITL
ncbi:MAG: peptidase [Cyclobacteriaceae bacterium]|nr:peptidase [Cyclobacteriaceae bacterium]